MLIVLSAQDVEDIRDAIDLAQVNCEDDQLNYRLGVIAEGFLKERRKSAALVEARDRYARASEELRIARWLSGFPRMRSWTISAMQQRVANAEARVGRALDALWDEQLRDRSLVGTYFASGEPFAELPPTLGWLHD